MTILELRKKLIQNELNLNGITQAEIARLPAIECSKPYVAEVIAGTRNNKTIQKYISRVIGVPFKTVWPTDPGQFSAALFQRATFARHKQTIALWDE